MNGSDREREPSEGSQESVDSLLRAVAHVRSPDLQSLPTIDVPNGSPAPSVEIGEHAPHLLPKVGDVIDERYVVEAVLGMGGMGVVYAARNVRTGKEVAIKYLRQLEGSKRQREERAARFVREAKAAGRIRHANVVDVYDVHGERAPYLVMERLHGESLGQRMKRGVLPPGEALNVVLGAMRGVAEAHKQGVVHRDLKPDNIFLARTGENAAPLPKVLDFGVSRLVDREGEEARHTTITRNGYVIGTPVYMPLEQLRGESNVDARADIYALGVVLYESLSGERPYQAKNDHELLIKLATEAPTPLARYLPEVDPALDKLIAKALERDPARRYPDVDSFMQAIERWLATPYALRPRAKRRGLWIGGLVGLLLMAFLIRKWRTPVEASPGAWDAPTAASVPSGASASGPNIAAEPPRPAPAEAAIEVAPTPGGAQERPALGSRALAEPPPTEPKRRRRIAPRPPLASPTRSEPPVDRATQILPTDF